MIPRTLAAVTRKPAHVVAAHTEITAANSALVVVGRFAQRCYLRTVLSAERARLLGTGDSEATFTHAVGLAGRAFIF